MDYNKYRYEKQKKAKEALKKQISLFHPLGCCTNITEGAEHLSVETYH